MAAGVNGKGDARRPCRTDRMEEDLRWALALGVITREMFDEQYAELERHRKIIRDGRVIRHASS